MHFGLPQIFIQAIKSKIAKSPILEAVLIPLTETIDPITKKKILVDIIGRYFFIGTNKPIEHETDLGIKIRGDLIIIRDEQNKHPVKVSTKDIKTVLSFYKIKKRSVIQQYISVLIRGGSLKNWTGTVTDQPNADDTVPIQFTSEEYNYKTDVPLVLCEPSYN
jgi:hypothetical protein